MIVYNLSIKIEASVEKDWLHWQQQEHIPEVMATRHFTEYKFYKLLEQDDTESATYVIQYFAVSLQNYHQYIEENAPLLRKKIKDKWGDKFVAFRTIMEPVN